MTRREHFQLTIRTTRQVAEMLGLHQTAVVKAEKSAFKKIKRAFMGFTR